MLEFLSSRSSQTWEDRRTTRRVCCRLLQITLPSSAPIWVLLPVNALALTRADKLNHSWAPQTYDKLRSWVPDGDPGLQKAFLDEYLPSVQWMRENGVPTAERFDGIMTIGNHTIFNFFPLTLSCLSAFAVVMTGNY